MNKAIYLFCLTHASELPVMEDESLMRFSPLFIHSFGEFNAVLSLVPEDEYLDQPMDSSLIDTEALMQRVFFHESIVELIMHSAAVFPVRFGTLFSSLASLEEQILKHQLFIAASLMAMNQKDEYAIRVYLNQDKAQAHLLSTLLQEREASWASCAQGVRYLKKQQLHNEVQSKLNQYLSDVLDDVLKELQLHAADFKNRESTTQLCEINGTSILNWAFLMKRALNVTFSEHVSQLNIQYNGYGLHFNLTGPWPAYSFCALLSE